MTRMLLAAVCASALSAAVAAQAPAGTPSSQRTASPGAGPQPGAQSAGTQPGGQSAGTQSGAPSSGTQPGAQATGSSRVVLTGCVDRADQLIPAGSTIGTTVDSLDLVLTHAELADSPHPVSVAPTGTSGASGASGSNGIGSIYKLDGPLSTLNPHVGHRVEITGTRVPSATAAPPPSSNAVNPSAASAPTIKVESVKLIAETCAR